MIPSATIPAPANEPVLGFLPGSAERAELTRELESQRGERLDIPLIIGGEEVRTGNTTTQVIPHDHGHVLADVHLAGEAEIARAVDAATEARHDWGRCEPAERAAVFLKAADLLAGPWRHRINAATMLNQSKTCHQAEIDAACELIDFFRFNCWYAQSLSEWSQPPISGGGVWNAVDLRPLDGFVYAIAPFNFTSIGANLCHAPALMGNTCIWKPSHSAQVSNYLCMRLMMEAGLPPGVINFVPGNARAMTAQLVGNADFGGLHYTGSTEVFRAIWQSIASNLDVLRSYPRVVGETGGKDFIVAHPSACPDAVIAALIRGSYEYQGQKCSASSRAYLPRSFWSAHRDRLVSEIESIQVGDPTVWTNFMGAVIHENSFDKCGAYIDGAERSADATVVTGGGRDGAKGWFVEPTLIEAGRPEYPSMCEEIFGPILTVFVYDDDDFSSILETCDRSSPYALTGAIFAQDRRAVDEAMAALRFSAGNFYINDKPTGAVVGQQPFGGGRASGTNDKAGSWLNLVRWANPRTVKETFVSPTDYRYGFLASD